MYKYDLKNQLTHVYEQTTSGDTISSSLIFYDDKSRPEYLYYDIAYAVGSASAVLETVYINEYNEDGNVDKYRVESGSTKYHFDPEYDSMDRVKKRTVNLIASAGTLTHTVEYGFTANGTNTSLQVSDYVSKISGVIVNQYQYVYDNNGNITQIKNASGVVQYQYAYDDLGQLVREDNRALNKSYTYSYDNAGNITSRKTYAFTTGTLGTATKTESYTYGNASWGDLVTAINGYSITYDAVGNPLTYYTGGLDSVLTWTNGRQLASYENMDGLRTYTYNSDGIRTSRTVNGVEHKYQLNGTQIVSETWGIHTIFFVYDENGSIAGMRYRTSSYAEGVFDEYLFEKNLQGDVVAIYNASGTKLVSYTYDAWGKVTTTYSNGGASTGARYNPFRYRGYYYDDDTGLYYLNSRYYDPCIGRFISADSSAVITATPNALTDKNLYAYCDNNPIMRKDNGGEFWSFVANVVIGAAISGGIDLAMQLIENGGNIKEVDWKSVGISALSGAVSSAIGGAASAVASKVKSVVGKAAINVVAGGISNLAGDAVSGNVTSFEDVGHSLANGMVSTVASEGINKIVKNIRGGIFKVLGKTKQKSVLTNKVFKKGNYYSSWTWKTYSKTNEFNEYLGKYSDVIDHTYSLITGVLLYD